MRCFGSVTVVVVMILCSTYLSCKPVDSESKQETSRKLGEVESQGPKEKESTEATWNGVSGGMVKALKVIQIRLYHDRGTTCFKGKKGVGLFMYGTRLLQNGGEEVVWRTEVSPTILSHWGDFGQRFAEAILHSDRVIFPDKYGKAYEYDRETGKLTHEGTKDDEHFKVLFDIWQYHMEAIYLVDRPQSNSNLDGGQRMGRGTLPGAQRVEEAPPER
jgi:hypothetical protein